MPARREPDADGRVRLWLEPARSPFARVASGALVLAIATLVGPGLLALGTLHVRVQCLRGDAAVDCRVTERALFGLLSRQREAHGVTGAEVVGGELTRVVLVGREGEVPVSGLATNVAGDEKQALVRQLESFFADGAAREADVSGDLSGPVAVAGWACSALWLLVVAAMLSWPVYALRPQRLLVDEAARTLSMRRRPGGREVVTAALSEVAKVSASVDVGGWLGRAVEASGQAGDAKRSGARPPLHLVITLTSGERLVLQNGARVPDEEVRAFAAEVAKLLRAPPG